MTKILHLQDVTKTFGGIVALDQFTATVDSGDVTGLIGPNGAGKTTLFNVITGVLEPDAGSVRFDGDDVTAYPAHRICRAGIARTFQTPKPIRSLTVEKNLRVAHHFGSDDAGDVNEHLEQTLELFDLGPKRDVLTDNLQLIEQKYVDIARGLMTSPSILLLDEIMAGLTPTEKNHISDTIRRINDELETSFLVVEHDLSTIRSISDRIVAMNEGRHMVSGTPEEVLSNAGLREAYIGA